MNRPGVSAVRIDTDFSSLTSIKDGITLLVISAPTAYLSTLSGTNFAFLTLEDAQNAGITEAKDLSNNAMVWEHIKDFMALAEGTELHIMFVPADTLLVNLFTASNTLNVNLKNYLALQEGKIALLGVALNPDYAENHTTSISTDLLNAIPFAQTFATAEFARNRPLDIFLEGRKYAGTTINASDLRLLNSGNVAVTIVRDKTRRTALVTAGHIGGVNNYAQIGLLLGKIASVHVGRNIGMVQTGALPVIIAEFSGGQVPYVNLQDSDLDLLHEKGYIYYQKYIGKSGWFFQTDNTAQLISKSSSRIAYNRVANKAIRLALQTYADYINSEVRVNSSNGKMDLIKVRELESTLENAIKQEMLNNPIPTRVAELSSVQVKIDPNQNILATRIILADVKIIPLGTLQNIITRIALINPNQ